MTSASPGKDDIFVAKFDDAGLLIWAKAMSGAEDEEGRDLVANNVGTIYVIGEFQGVVDFAPNVNAGSEAGKVQSSGEYDVFVAKFARPVPNVGDQHIFMPAIEY